MSELPFSGTSEEDFFAQQALELTKGPNAITAKTQRDAGPNFFREGEMIPFARPTVLLDQACMDSRRLAMQVETVEFVNKTAQTHDTVMHQFIRTGKAGLMHFDISFHTHDIFRIKFSDDLDVLRTYSDDPTFPPEGFRMLLHRPRQIQVDVTSTDSEVILQTHTIRLSIQNSPFHLSATRRDDDEPFWQQRLPDTFTADAITCSVARAGQRCGCFEAFTLSPDETIYGLGERFDAVSRIGRPVDFVNHDVIGSSNPRSYINVPFFWSTSGYGCFINSSARTEFDIGVREASTLSFSVEDAILDYFIISGSTPADIIQRYTQHLTGSPIMPPVWTFGLWLSRNSYQSWTQVDEILDQCARLKIPADVIHLDTSWFAEDWNCDLKFGNPDFDDHENKIASLKKDGIHVSLWQYPYVPRRIDNDLFLEGVEGGHFARDGPPGTAAHDDIFTYPEGCHGWKIDDAIIDLSNPQARSWYADKIAALIRQGVSAIKTDFGDCIPPAAHYMNTKGSHFQNLYSLVYNATVSAAVRSVSTDTVLWARSGTAGSQRYSVHWGGDSQSSWPGLQGSLRATLSIGLSGFTFFSHDIGGFAGRPDPELYIRWTQLGLLGVSHARLHGSGDTNAREPWTFGETATDVFRKFAELRYRLLPYIIGHSRQGCESGMPLIRHLILHWPHDRNVRHIETQYMLGPSIMVAPCLRSRNDTGKTMPVYFPEDSWFEFWTGEHFLHSRGEWLDIPTPPIDSMAMWVRADTALCMAAGGRLRTNNSVGHVAQVLLYGPGDEGTRACDDGSGGVVTIAQDDRGLWCCSEDAGVQVVVYAGA